MEPNKTPYYAIMAFDYKPPAEHTRSDFGKNEYARYKRRADKAEIVERMYSPFPHLIRSEPEKTALLYFKTEEKFKAFREYTKLREKLHNEGFGFSAEYNVVEPKIKLKEL